MGLCTEVQPFSPYQPPRISPRQPPGSTAGSFNAGFRVVLLFITPSSMVGWAWANASGPSHTLTYNGEAQRYIAAALRYDLLSHITSDNRSKFTDHDLH
jgi:hypothetical protein